MMLQYVLRSLTSAIERRVKDHLINETISRSLSDYEAEIRPLIVKAVEEITLKQFRQVMNDYQYGCHRCYVKSML
jgi:hypothetical protein